MKIKKIHLIILIILAVLFGVIFFSNFLHVGRRYGQKIEQTSKFRYAISKKLNQVFLQTGKYPEQVSDILNEIPHPDFTVKLQSYVCDLKSYKIVVILCFYQSEYMEIEEKAINSEIIYSKFDSLDSNDIINPRN